MQGATNRRRLCSHRTCKARTEFVERRPKVQEKILTAGMHEIFLIRLRRLFSSLSIACPIAIGALCLAPASLAHVGSPNVYFQGYAGPYHLVVMVRTPQMIPGIAEIEVRSEQAGIRQLRVTPLFIVGPGSKYPPPPDVLRPAPDDARFFTGKIWLMESGSWQVRIEADGKQGSGTVAVPVPAAARS